MAFGAFQKSSQDFIATSASSQHRRHRNIRFIASSASSHRPLLGAGDAGATGALRISSIGRRERVPEKHARFPSGGYVTTKADVARAQRSIWENFVLTLR